MSSLANDYKAVNLSQGFPDFPVDKELNELLYKAVKGGHNQYAPMPGIVELR
ncbi:MAG: methionine aminotransferase, partial [Ignavibacteria bacterium]|nr:methionine aminotransferase [Ignavibacteria bacterium]